jgi:hypothetical protein
MQGPRWIQAYLESRRSPWYLLLYFVPFWLAVRLYKELQEGLVFTGMYLAGVVCWFVIRRRNAANAVQSITKEPHLSSKRDS